ncbi:hypothetical protein MVES1_001868 [Malassezia vespertilionis]|uniref:uncharacterized protein n=1 Tax=Malassezia vespertilionis TaxID=2020962 RepID=UPI0024B14DC1|nr:uncharacterized protein MVES1_001868 [Malassezia vespertilionis]WFD06521.1 hypothetical protein MVES1_001868 [Malassezia vespertilionis]
MSAEENPPSRFVSQVELSEAQERRERQIKEAYERMGEAPPEPDAIEEKYDPRPLYEQDLKQEQMDAMFKNANRYRGLDESESDFLASIELDKKRREQKKKEQVEYELAAFRRAAEEKANIKPPTENRALLSSIPKAKPRGSVSKRKRKTASALGIVRKPAASSTTEQSGSEGQNKDLDAEKKRTRR